jgi:shikimate kinase
VNNIYFSGVIGVGKTTIGIAMAERLNRPFDDLDRAIEREAGMTIGEVVARDGWLQYRSLEYAICKKFAQMDKAVIAMAGGTPRYEWNRDVLMGSGVNILLTADLSILPGRVGDHDRPRVNPVSSLAEDLARIWSEYGDVYKSFSDIVYPTDQGKTVTEEINELLQILHKTHPKIIAE